MLNKSVAVTYLFKYSLRLTSKFNANFNIILTPWSPQVASVLQASQLKFLCAFLTSCPAHFTLPFVLLYLVGSTSVEFVKTSFPSPSLSLSLKFIYFSKYISSNHPSLYSTRNIHTNTSIITDTLPLLLILIFDGLRDFNPLRSHWLLGSSNFVSFFWYR